MLANVLLASISGLELVFGGVSDFSLLVFALSPGEENEFALVVFKTLHVQLESFFGGVLSSVVHSNAYCPCELPGQTSSLDLLQSEPSPVSSLRVVPSGERMHDRSQLLNWTGEYTSSLSLSSG